MRRLVLALSLLLIAAPTAQAKKPKPGLKVYGISVNQVFVAKGTTVKPMESTNTCYRIGGASGEPQSVTAMVYVRAIKIPKNAVTHYEFHVPWDSQTADETVFDGPFNKALFRSTAKNTGGVFGGPTGKHDYFRYRMLPTGSPTSSYIHGDFSFKVTATTGGKTYSAHGKITLNCQ